MLLNFCVYIHVVIDHSENSTTPTNMTFSDAPCSDHFTTSVDPTAVTSITFSGSSIVTTALVQSTCDGGINTEAAVATVTTTVTSTTMTHTYISNPSTTATHCFNQQANDSESNCNAVAICIPVAVAIALILCVIVFVGAWKLRNRKMCGIIHVGIIF